MIKLKNIIDQLDDATVTIIENNFKKNKADNFLFLFQSYKNGKAQDNAIAEQLEITLNSYYVLKSRLYDKIQEFILGIVQPRKEELLTLLQAIPHLCLSKPREISTAYLEKLEQQLLLFDMHHELLLVYSALKRNHIFSDQYFTYSQKYNKHLAFSMSLEKSEEILGSFSRELALYNLSRSQKSISTLLFLKKGLNDHFELSKSRQIDLISTLLDVQMELFCEDAIERTGKSTEDKLKHLDAIINGLPVSSHYKNWSVIVDFLYFEYFFKTGHQNQTDIYFEKVQTQIATLFLYTNVCVTSRFLISKITYHQLRENLEDLQKKSIHPVLFDPNDRCSGILLGINNAMNYYYLKDYRSCTFELNKILNENSFKDYFHINTEVRLSLAYIYIVSKDLDLAENQIKSVQRKVKNDQIIEYEHVLDLIKVFSTELKAQQASTRSKQRDHLTLFLARNKGQFRILSFLEFELKKRYS